MRFLFVTFFVLATVPSHGQVREIDRTKLPSDTPVQHAYDDLLPINAFARTFENKRRFPVPQDEVTKRLKADLQTLESAQKAHPDNTELQLLTGLTAHLAYNLDVQEAYEPAMNLLGALAQNDFRAAWFLAIHQCQSNETVGGMNRLLAVEASTAKPPADFWQDYANCAQNTFMPVHAVRAWDKADALNDGTVVDPALERVARNMIKPSSNTAKYTAKEAWIVRDSVSKVRSTSVLCGISFETLTHNDVKFADVDHGSCNASAATQSYPTRTQPSRATIVMTSAPADPGQTLQTFTRDFLKADPHWSAAKATAGLPCPTKACLEYEVTTNDAYPEQGGAHVLAVFFASEQPQYPGLKLENPVSLPRDNSKSSQQSFIIPDQTQQRLPGTHFFIIILDTSQDTYKPSRADYETFLRNLVVDTK